jgi:hypothetical protein
MSPSARASKGFLICVTRKFQLRGPGERAFFDSLLNRLARRDLRGSNQTAGDKFRLTGTSPTTIENAVNPSMLCTLRKPWLWCTLLGAALALTIYFVLPGEQRDIRYRAAGEWRLAGESKFVGQPGSGRYASVAVGAGFTSDGNWFRVVGSELHIGPDPNDPPETVLALPSDLLNSRSWSVVASADGQRTICVNERGLAVWRGVPPHELMHCWTVTTEPLAGKKVGEDRDGDTPYDRHELVLAYSPSPDGSMTSVFAIEQRGFSSQQPHPNGVVVVRDLESGQDVAELVHHNCGPVIERVAWSADSQRLATFAPQAKRLTVWDVTKRDVICRIAEFAEQLSLSPNGSLVYTVFTGRTTSGAVGPDRPRTAVYRVADGSLVGSRRIACNQLVLSPDGKHLATSTAKDVGLMDSLTLEDIWSSPGGGYRHFAFRRDGAELAAVGVNLGGLVATAQVKAWNVTRGTVLLDAPTNAGSGTTYGIGFGKDGAIWTYGPSHWNQFEPTR